MLSKDLIENGDPQAYIREQIENWIGKELPKTPKLTIDYINERIGRGDIHFL